MNFLSNLLIIIFTSIVILTGSFMIDAMEKRINDLHIKNYEQKFER